LANPTVTKERKRRWTGFAVALTVTFTVCDAQQTGLSPSSGLFFPINNIASLQTMRPEQKAPPILAPLRISNQALVSRKQVIGTPRYFDGFNGSRYSLVPPGCGLNTLCSQSHSGESNRGPPLRGPPIFC